MSGMYFSRVLEAALLPPAGPLLCIVLGLLLMMRWRNLGYFFAWVGVGATLLTSMPLLVRETLYPLEDFPVLTQERVNNAQAIVILGGGRRTFAPEFGGTTVNHLTLERLRYGAYLAKRTHLPVLVAGGGGADERSSEARYMRDVLTNEFGVSPKWAEGRSRNTEENAQLSAKLLQKDNIKTVLLVTHAAHMKRAVSYFEEAGFTVIPAPTVFNAPRAKIEDMTAELPSGNSAYAGWYATHEWAGILAHKLHLKRD